MTSNNIQMKDTNDGVVVKADGRTLLAKLVFAGSARLAECDLGIDELRAAFKRAHGEEASQGTLTYRLNENDGDALQLVDDADLALAKKHGSEPLKITSTEVDTRDVFDHASAELAKHGLDAPATELKKLLDVLQFAPRRLVKCGLAPPKALKNTLKGDEAEEPEDVYVVEMAEALAIEDEPKPVTTGLAALQKTANEAAAALDKEADATLDDAALAAKLQAEEYGNHDVILEAVTGRGIKLDSNTLHSLLRILYCRPARFVQLGLVEDIKAARQAFKLGGKACANEWFRNKGCHGRGGKGWGRGLHGRGCHGRGRGAGWAFEADIAEALRAEGWGWGHRGGHGKGKGCHGRRRSRSREGRGCHGKGHGGHGHPWGPPPPPASPPPADPRGCGRW